MISMIKCDKERRVVKLDGCTNLTIVEDDKGNAVYADIYEGKIDGVYYVWDVRLTRDNWLRIGKETGWDK